MNILQYAQIIAIVVLWVIYIYGLFKVIRGRSANKWNIVLGFTFATLLLFHLTLNAYTIASADWVQIMLTFGLVLATIQYAISAAKQADASMKMAEEMREQRIISSRPVIIQRAVYKDSDWPDIKIGWTGIIPSKTASYFSHFEVHNEGSGPAIEVEISILDKERRLIESFERSRRTFLKANDPPLKFCPSIPSEGVASYYVACEYQSIISRNSQQQTWYQTLLPFKSGKSSKAGEIYVATDELEFYEVTEKERIDAFSSRSKPK